MHRLLLPSLVLLLAACATVPQERPAAPPEPPVVERHRAELRGLGLVEAEARIFGQGPGQSSWTSWRAEDPARAAMLASKRRGDLLGFGDLAVVADSGLPGTVLELAAGGSWLLGVEGGTVHELFAPTRAALAALAQQAGAAAWTPAPAKAHPRWLDCFDQAGLGIWLGGGGAQFTLPADFAWLRERGLTMCTLPPTESRIVGPGMLDSTIFDWYTTMAAQHDLAYRVLFFPSKHEWLWNRHPLPYVVPEAGRSAVAPCLYQNVNTSAASFEPVPAVDPHVLDGRRRLAERLARDPNHVGMHGCDEVPEAHLDQLAWTARTPGTKQLWHAYLGNVLGMDLARVGQLHAGDPARYRSWAEVEVPLPADFLGWDPATCIDLRGTWQIHEDVERRGHAAGWQDPAKAPADWVEGDCSDPALFIYTPLISDDAALHQHPETWMRRTVEVPAAAVSRLRFLHFGRAVYHNLRPQTYDVWLNGRKLEQVHRSGMANRGFEMTPFGNGFDQCFDTAGAVVAGGNRLVVATHGATMPGHAFLGAVPWRPYPRMSEAENRRYFDAINFEAWLRVSKVEANLRATRAADPDRPIKLMAMINMLDLTIPLCEKYGAYQHDTGGSAGYWCPMSGARLSRSHGLPWSCEQGGPPANVEEMRKAATFYLMYGNDASDLVFAVTHYRDKPGVSQWFDENLELLRSTGKLALPTPAVALLRASGLTRLGFSEPWNWDVGRGPLQQIGRNFTYLEAADLGTPVSAPHPVVLDCGTILMTDEEVAGILRYVRDGGVFVAQHHTARHLPERAEAWPLARAVGLAVKDLPGSEHDLRRIRFAADQDLLPSLRGQALDGHGVAIDWMKQEHTGAVAFSAAGRGAVRAIASWEGGGLAVAEVRVGRGRLIFLGTPLFNRMRDQHGVWLNEAGRGALLDEMLGGLGAPRDSWATGLWAERWRSKNGVYDLYPVARMERGASDDAITAGAQIRRGTAPARVVEIGAKGHPAVAATWQDGRLTLPAAAYLPMQSRLYAAPAEDIARGGLAWFRTQAGIWRALPPLPAARQPARVEVPDDLLPLADGWTLQVAGQPARTVALGAFATLGLPETAVAVFEKTVAVPRGWKDRRVSLVFDAENWFWGILPRGRLQIDGADAAMRQPITPQPNPGFTLDVTAAAADGRITLRLEVDGSGPGMPWPEKNGQSKPYGVTGIFYLQSDSIPSKVEPLPAPWSAAVAFNRLVPVAADGTASGMYLENRFALPAAWPAPRVFLASDGPLGFLIINGTVLQCPGWMSRLDVSGLLRRDGSQNVIRWVPAARDTPEWRKPWTGTVPAMRLEWSGG